MFGVKRTAIMLQDIVGVDQDGRMGLVTLNAINQMPEDTVLTQIAFAQIRSRAVAVVKDSSQVGFLIGWLSRAQDLGYAVEKK
jgi:lysozyme family protein